MINSTRPLIAMALVALAIPSIAFAQRDAGSKIRGDAYNAWSGNRAGNAMRSAREYSGYYRQYTHTVPAPQADPEVARDAADTIGTYITKARRHFSWMRTQAQATNDKETLASLDDIDANLAAAAKSHHEMHDTCLKASVDSGVTMRCCQQIDEHLSKAIAEHDKLMKRLGGDKAATPSK